MVRTQKALGRRFLQGVLLATALVATLATFIATTTAAVAQSDVPDAPTGVAAYSIRTTELEVRWSTADATNTTSFKVQWKSGSEDFDSSRQATSDPATSIVSEQSTTAGDRYAKVLTGLTNGTEYTMRVIATNSNGDSVASGEATATPKSLPGEAPAFIENEVVEIFEGSHPWLREAYDYLTTNNVPIAFNTAIFAAPGTTSYVLTSCTNTAQEMNLRKCRAVRVNIYRSEPHLIHTIHPRAGACLCGGERSVFQARSVGSRTPVLQ